MEFNNQEELMQAAADIYSMAETIYKGSEINADTLYSTAKNHFDFTDAQLNQLSDYFQKEEQEFWGLEDDSLKEAKELPKLKQTPRTDGGKNYKKIDLYVDGEYWCSTNASKTIKDAIEKAKKEYPELKDREIKGSFAESKKVENRPNKITYKELKEIFTNINKNKEPDKYGVIVFTEDSFTKPYSLESRSYKVSSDNKVFKPDALGYSLYGSALDGSDDEVRLESYMKEEHGGSDGWKVDYCYILDNEKEVE